MLTHGKKNIYKKKEEVGYIVDSMQVSCACPREEGPRSSLTTLIRQERFVRRPGFSRLLPSYSTLFILIRLRRRKLIHQEEGKYSVT